MSAPRPLPPRPSLEFERKEAKALLRQLRAGNHDALHRAAARHPAVQAVEPGALQLADAQLIIAREYGFASWPRLVNYFEDAQRVLHRTPSTVNPNFRAPETHLQRATSLVERHQQRVPSATRSLIAYVPRFYAQTLEEAFALDVTEEEARLAVARENGFASWDALLARIQAHAASPMRAEGLDKPPLRRAVDAIREANLTQLQLVVDEHPTLLTPTEHEMATGMHLLAMAVNQERDDHAQHGDRSRMQPIMHWLASNGFDVQRELDIRLCGHRRMTVDEVEYWIERGANANWVAPNGYSVLEHAIVRYFSASALDRLARFATVPQRALWIAAGLGDVAGVESLLDRHGKPVAVARAHRPNFDAIGPRGLPLLPGDDDEEILMEAAMVAFMNGRTAMMGHLVARGFPIDTLRWDMPFVAMAVGNGEVDMVETLVRCGADLDLRGSYNGSAREMARDLLVSQPPQTQWRRIAELCGLDADAMLAARDARPPSSPTYSSQLTRVLALANDDARRLGSAVVTPEHVMVGWLRAGDPAVRAIVEASGMDRTRFTAGMGERVRRADAIAAHESLPVDMEVQAALDAAVDRVAQARGDLVHPPHVLLALVQTGTGVVPRIIAGYGGHVAPVQAFLHRLR